MSLKTRRIRPPRTQSRGTRGANAEIVAAKGFVEFADPFAQNTHEEAGDEVHVAEVPPGVLPRESTSGDSPLRRQEYADGNGRTDPCDHSGLDLNEDLSSDKASGSPALWDSRSQFLASPSRR